LCSTQSHKGSSSVIQILEARPCIISQSKSLFHVNTNCLMRKTTGRSSRPLTVIFGAFHNISLVSTDERCLSCLSYDTSVISTDCLTTGWMRGFTGGRTDKRETAVMGGRCLKQKALVALPGPPIPPLVCCGLKS
jgi:hypothetical protein